MVDTHNVLHVTDYGRLDCTCKRRCCMRCPALRDFICIVGIRREVDAGRGREAGPEKPSNVDRQRTCRKDILNGRAGQHHEQAEVSYPQMS